MILIRARLTGFVLHHCQTWAEVFALDYPIGAVASSNGVVEVRTQAYGDRACALRHGLDWPFT